MARPTARYAVTAEDRTKQGLDSVRRSLGGLKSQFAALGATLTAGAFAAVTKEAIAQADELNKLSTQLGFSTEALSQYQFVAQQTGVEFRTLTQGLQRMTRRVAEAAQGTGEAKNALFELGVDAEKLTKLRPEQQFEVLADAFANVDDQSTKVRLAFKLFDAEGVRLLRTMEGGSAAVQQLRAVFDRLGGTLTQETADAATQATDAIGRLKATFSASAVDIVRIFGPAITTAANYLAENIPKAVLQAERFLVRARQGFVSIAASIAGLFGNDEAAENLRDLASVYGEQFDRMGQAVDNFKVKLPDAVNAQDFFDDSLRANIETKKKSTAAQKELNKELERAKQITEDVRTPFEVYSDSIAELEGLFARSKISQETFNRAVEQTKEQFREGIGIDPTPIQEYSAALADLEDALGRGAISFDEYARARFAAESALEGDTQDTKDKIQETENALVDFGKQAGSNVKDAFSEFFFDPFNSDLDGLVSNFANAMRKVAAEAAANAALKAILGATGGSAGTFGSLFGRALGGPIGTQTPVLVGERGPELLTNAPPGSSIQPNGGMQAITVNVSAAASANRDSANQIGYDIGRQIQDSMRRNS